MVLHVFFFFFSYESLSNSRFRIPCSYSRHFLPSSSSLQRFPSQRNPDSAGHRNCTLLPATSKCLRLALKSARNIIVNCDYVAKFYTKCMVYYTREPLKDLCRPLNYMTCLSPFSVVPEQENFTKPSLFDYTRVMVRVANKTVLNRDCCLLREGETRSARRKTCRC